MMAAKNDDPPGLLRVDRAAQRLSNHFQVTMERGRRRLMKLGCERELTLYVEGTSGGFERAPPWDLERPVNWETGTIELSAGRPWQLTDSGAAEPLYPTLYVDEDSLDAVLTPPPSPTMVAAAAPAISARASAMGRPSTHDWDGARVQLLRRCVQHGLPHSKAEVTAELSAWFLQKSPAPPEPRTIERKVAEDFWPVIEDLARPCELIPGADDRRNRRN